MNKTRLSSGSYRPSHEKEEVTGEVMSILSLETGCLLSTSKKILYLLTLTNNKIQVTHQQQLEYFYIVFISLDKHTVLASNYQGGLDKITISSSESQLTIQENVYQMEEGKDSLTNNVFRIIRYKDNLLCFCFSGRVILLDRLFNQISSYSFPTCLQIIELDYHQKSSIICIAFDGCLLLIDQIEVFLSQLKQSRYSKQSLYNNHVYQENNQRISSKIVQIKFNQDNNLIAISSVLDSLKIFKVKEESQEPRYWLKLNQEVRISKEENEVSHMTGINWKDKNVIFIGLCVINQLDKSVQGSAREVNLDTNKSLWKINLMLVRDSVYTLNNNTLVVVKGLPSLAKLAGSSLQSNKIYFLF